MRVGYLPSKRDRLTCEPFMSADDSSRLASDPPPTDDDDKVQPTVRDALIGGAIGLVLFYAGTRISYWILRWLVIGVGLMFVGVMSAFVISVIWTKVSPRAHLIMSRARGHVRRDPQLGTLIRNVESEAWSPTSGYGTGRWRSSSTERRSPIRHSSPALASWWRISTPSSAG